jgi:hypothetical protein
MDAFVRFSITLDLFFGGIRAKRVSKLALSVWVFLGR